MFSEHLHLLVKTVVSLLGLDTGISAALLCIKLVTVSKTASKPELSTGIRYVIVVPLRHIVPTWSWIQSLAAALSWT